MESGVLHPQRIEDALAQEGLERPARHPRDEYAEHVVAEVVVPVLSGLAHQRQRAQAAHPLVRLGQRLRALAEDAPLEDRVHDRRAHRRQIYAEPERGGQQVPYGDRPSRGNGLVQRTVDPLQHLTVGEFGQPLLHRVVQSQSALVEQGHHRRHRDRFGRGRHAEDRVPAHRRATVMAHRPDRLDVRLITQADQGDESGDLPGLDMPCQYVAHSVQPRLGEAAVVLSHHESPCVQCSICATRPGVALLASVSWSLLMGPPLCVATGTRKCSGITERLGRYIAFTVSSTRKNAPTVGC